MTSGHGGRGSRAGVIATLVGAALLCLAALAGAAEPVVIKFSHVLAADTPKGQAAEFFKESAERRTRGRVRVDIYPNGELYGDQVELAALELGSVQMLAPSLSKLGVLGTRDFEVFDLPFLFQDEAQVHGVTQGPIGRTMLKKLEGKGITGLAFWDSGFKQMSASRALRSPADFRGLKMRIQPSRVLHAQMLALGASPRAMAFSDLYQGLRTGLVDGTENSLSNFHSQQLHRVQSHLTLSNHGYLGYVLMVNKKFWDGLPAGIRDALAAAVAEATQFANQMARRKNDEALAAVARSRKTEIIALTPEEKRQWIGALLPVHQEQARLIGRDLVQAVYRETGFAPGRLAHGQDSPRPQDGAAPAALLKSWSTSLLAALGM